MKNMLFFLLIISTLISIGLASRPFTIQSAVDIPQTRPRIAHNAPDDEFLVVWEHQYSLTDWDINGQVLDGDGTPLGPRRQIAWVGTNQNQNPDVAFNMRDKRYLVVYELSPGNHNVSGAMLDENADFLEWVNIAQSDTDYDGNPAVAYDVVNNDFVVAFEATWLEPVGLTNHIVVEKFNSEGDMTECYANVTPLESTLLYANPAVACVWGRPLVVWDVELTNGSRLVYGRIIGNDDWGDLLAIGSLYTYQSNPQVTCNPQTGQYCVVWQARESIDAPYRIHCRIINPDGSFGSDTIDVGANDDDHRMLPDVEFIGGRCQTYLITWAQGTSPIPSLGNYGIAARRLSRDGTPNVNDEQFWIVEPAALRSNNRPAVTRGDRCTTLIAWDRYVQGLGGSNTYSIMGHVGLDGILRGDLDCDLDVDLEDLGDFADNWLIGR